MSLHAQAPATALPMPSPFTEFSSPGNTAGSLRIGGFGLALVFMGLVMSASDALLQLVNILFIAGLITLIIALIQVVRAPSHKQQRVWVFTDGLILVHGKAVDGVTWADIQAVYQNTATAAGGFLPLLRSHTYTVRTVDGREIMLTGRIRNVEHLGEMLQGIIARRQLPAAIRALKNDERLDFGPASVGRAGLQVGGETLPWENIKRIKHANGRINIKREGSAFARTVLPAHEIPNLQLFLTLVTRIVSPA